MRAHVAVIGILVTMLVVFVGGRIFRGPARERAEPARTPGTPGAPSAGRRPRWVGWKRRGARVFEREVALERLADLGDLERQRESGPDVSADQAAYRRPFMADRTRSRNGQ